ncbi:MAG: hypothetical protein K2F82_05250, partial [Muribaculaceae bacterium]|nr:hypothetical protein [Muribaculaceae bacterium]
PPPPPPFFFNDPATTEIYPRLVVGSVRCVYETGPWITADGRRFSGAIGSVLPSGHIVIAGRTFAFKEVWPADICDPSRHD